jgi:hypothetical protein
VVEEAAVVVMVVAVADSVAAAADIWVAELVWVVLVWAALAQELADQLRQLVQTLDVVLRLAQMLDVRAIETMLIEEIVVTVAIAVTTVVIVAIVVIHTTTITIMDMLATGEDGELGAVTEHSFSLLVL